MWRRGSELILDLDGLARDIKELGQGKVWILATGQQTLTENLGESGAQFCRAQ